MTVHDGSRLLITICRFATCWRLSIVLRTYTNVCGIIILEQGMLLHFFHWLFVLFASRCDLSQTVTSFNGPLRIKCIGHVWINTINCRAHLLNLQRYTYMPWLTKKMQLTTAGTVLLYHTCYLSENVHNVWVFLCFKIGNYKTSKIYMDSTCMYIEDSRYFYNNYLHIP